MSEQHRRWPFLEDNLVLTKEDWLPPAEDCPRLSDLREAHLRILTATREANRAAGDLRRKQEAELEAVRAAEEEALFTGKTATVPEVTVSDAEIIEAREKAEAARDALQRFARHAVAQIQERAPEIVASLDEARAEAVAKRLEAQALLTEADALEATPKRLRRWLDRVTGESKLAHVPYEGMPVPANRKSLGDLERVLVSSATGGTQEVAIYG
jgi:hypothetical protein